MLGRVYSIEQGLGVGAACIVLSRGRECKWVQGVQGDGGAGLQGVQGVQGVQGGAGLGGGAGAEYFREY